MTDLTPCHLVEQRSAELADPRLDGALDAELTALRAHARECGACEAALAFHRELAEALSQPLSVPDAEVPVPSLAEVPVLPIARWTSVLRPAAAAAAIFALAAVLVQGAFLSGSTNSYPVRVQVVEADSSAPAVPDQGLLALTAGWEAVASLRPALPR